MAFKVILFLGFLLVKVVACILHKVKPLGPPSRDSRPRRQRYQEPNRDANSRFEISLTEIAKRLNGQVVLGVPDQVHFSVKGIAYTATITQKYGNQTIRVSAKWHDPNFRMKVFPSKKGKIKKRYLGVDDFEVGDKKFDRHFVVQGNSINGVANVLDRKVTRAIRRHWKSVHGRIEIDVGGGTITLGGKSTKILKKYQVLAIIKNFVKIHSMMMPRTVRFSVGDPAILEMTYVEQKNSTCMVCGQTVGQEGVDCVRCDTRHHRDCWKYIGQCSTYGCQSRRAD